MMEAYAEYGAIGVMVLLFAAQVLFLQRTLMKELHEIEDICVKLIDRWNRSDEARDRRHEDLIKEFQDTDLGIFKVNASLGTHFGNMKRFR